MKLAFLSALAIGLAAAAPAETLKQHVDATNKQFALALKNSDTAMFAKLLKAEVTSDYVYIEQGQKMTAAQVISTMTASMKQMGKVTKSSAVNVSVKEKGDKGDVVNMHYITSVMKDPGSKKTHTTVYSGKSTEGYRKVAGKWKMYKMTFTDTKMTMDGKPFNPGMGAPPKQ